MLSWIFASLALVTRCFGTAKTRHRDVEEEVNTNFASQAPRNGSKRGFLFLLFSPPVFVFVSVFVFVYVSVFVSSSSLSSSSSPSNPSPPPKAPSIAPTAASHAHTTDSCRSGVTLIGSPIARAIRAKSGSFPRESIPTKMSCAGYLGLGTKKVSLRNLRNLYA